jgi:hypothetical protein
MDPMTTAELTSALLAPVLKALGVALTLLAAAYGPRAAKALASVHLDAAQRAAAAMAVRAAEQTLDNNHDKYKRVAAFLVRQYPALGTDPALMEMLIEGAVHDLKAGVLAPLERELTAPPAPPARE